MKKIFALVLAICLVVTVFGITAYADETYLTATEAESPVNEAPATEDEE